VVGEIPDEGQFQLTAEITLTENEDGEPSRRFRARVAADALTGEQSRSRQARFQQFLCDHLRQAEKYAAALAERLLPDGPERIAVRLAARWHDLGKVRRIWQQGVGNPDPDQPWAKSGRSGRIYGLNDYRHELGSLVDLADPKQRFNSEFQAQPVEVRELVLHLIAAHHGRGRPHFPVDLERDPPRDETFEPEPKGRNVAAIAAGVPQRFGRMQRKYGRWGLAYLESLVRAADILATQRAEGGVL
jgi:CRISPR-associated endonuclease/helicase Cas3